MKKTEKMMVAFRLPIELHKKIKQHCLDHNIKMQDFLSETVEKALEQK